jgi:hypothetical protein
MKCEEYKVWITGYVDHELPDEQRQQLEEHLRDCQTCQRELRETVAIKENLTMIKFKEPSDADLQRYWSSVYNRLERGVGWVLFSLGAIIALCYGGIRLVEQVIVDPNIAVVAKVGIIALIVGGAVLIVSVLRERLTVRKTDKYSREVER